jgi:Zn-dependent protease
MDLARTSKMEFQPITDQQQKPYKYSVTYEPLAPTNGKIRFSAKEIKHLTAAALLVVGVGLSVALFPSFFYNTYAADYIVPAAFAVILIISFFTHEIAHKVAAQRRGLWAEFRLTRLGAILTLVSIIPSFFKIISPGAVMVAGFTDKENMGKISIAGPITNLIFSVTFLAGSFILSPFLPFQYETVLLIAAFFNAWIALFNLVPFGIFDGFKIFQWNKRIWGLIFTSSLILTIILYMLIW